MCALKSMFTRTARLVSRVLSDDEKNAVEKQQDHIPSIFPDIYPGPKNRAVFLIRRWRRRARERERERETQEEFPAQSLT